MKLFKNNQSGRSMIEMLGVLAIIGVLSIGGIAGYSKAMFKYKFNKTMDIVSNAIARLVELENSNLGSIFIETAQNLRDYSIIPNCNPATNYTCQQPLGKIHIFFQNPPASRDIGIYFAQHPYKSCVAFLNSKIYETIPDHWWYPTEEGEDGGYIEVLTEEDEIVVYSKTGYVDSKSELTTNDILDACQICKDTEECTIALNFKN